MKIFIDIKKVPFYGVSHPSIIMRSSKRYTLEGQNQVQISDYSANCISRLND